MFQRALPRGYDNVLGTEPHGEKDRQRVRSIRQRLTETLRPGDPEHEDRFTDAFFVKDLLKMIDTLQDLISYFEPQTKLSWWEDQYQAKGLAYQPGLEGMAAERSAAIVELGNALALLHAGYLTIR